MRDVEVVIWIGRSKFYGILNEFSLLLKKKKEKEKDLSQISTGLNLIYLLIELEYRDSNSTSLINEYSI